MKAEHEPNTGGSETPSNGGAVEVEGKRKGGNPGGGKGARGGAYAKVREKQLAAALLMEAGLTPEQAAERVGYSKTGADKLVARIKGNGIDFVTKNRVKAALQVTDSFLAGRAIGGVAPNPSVTWQAAQAVIDRAYPKAAPEGSAPMTFTTVNLTLIQAPTVQDTAETVVSPPVIELQPQ